MKAKTPEALVLTKTAETFTEFLSQSSSTITDHDETSGFHDHPNFTTQSSFNSTNPYDPPRNRPRLFKDGRRIVPLGLITREFLVPNRNVPVCEYNEFDQLSFNYSPKQYNYINMIMEHKRLRPYLDWKHCKPQCALCHKNPSTVVIFPCHHKCICHTCQVIHNVKGRKVRSDRIVLCPVCEEEVVMAFSYERGLQDKYFDICYKYDRVIPKSFHLNLMCSKAAIRSKMKSKRNSSEVDDECGINCSLISSLCRLLGSWRFLFGKSSRVHPYIEE